MYQSHEVSEQMQIFLTSANEVQRTSAHNYLMSFQSSSDAWSICRELMVPSTPQIPLLLSSQIFYKKLQTELSSLNNSQKLELKNYLVSLVQIDFSYPQMQRKICQCIALVGIVGIQTYWEDFLIDVLRITRLEIMLDIIDCIPFCLEEYVLSKKTVEMVKSKIRENIQSIMEVLYLTIKEKGYIVQVLEILKNWRIVTLPIFSHNGLFEVIIEYMRKCDDVFPQICEAFCNALNTCPYAELLQQGRYKGSVGAYTNHIPQPDLQNLLVLLQMIIELPFLEARSKAVQKAGSELIIAFSTNFMFFFLEPVKLWEKIRDVIGHQNLSVVMNGIEFYFSFKEVVVNLGELPWHVFDWLFVCVRSLALRCKFISYDFFMAALSQKSEDEDIGFMQFRISAEDVFYAVFLIFEKHHPEKGRGLIKELGNLLSLQDEMSMEVFIYMMRSMLLGISDFKEWSLLQDVMHNQGIN